MPFIRIVKHFGECVNTQSIISHREMKQHGSPGKKKSCESLADWGTHSVSAILQRCKLGQIP